MWTVFNPTDQKYGLKTHFGNDLSDPKFEHLRTLHLVAARGAEAPRHYAYDFNGAQGVFNKFKE